MSVVLTPEEQRQFGPLFKQYDKEGTQIVLGEHVRPLLERSGVAAAQLGQIWQIADGENRGFLDQEGFVKCMRMLYHVQHGQPLSARLANIPSGLPSFDHSKPLDTTKTSPPGASSGFTPDGHHVNPSVDSSVSPPGLPVPPASRTDTFAHNAQVAAGSGSSLLSANGETRIPPLNTAEKQRFGQLFDRSCASDGMISGDSAREIFLKARLPSETLAKIWSLVDVQGRGRLTKNEFVVAMHLIQSTITKAMPEVPSSLPSQWLPWLGTPSQRQGSISSLPSVSQLQHQTSGIAANTLSRQVSGEASGIAGKSASRDPSIWNMSVQEKAQFGAIFESLDRQHSGIIGANEAVPVLTKSGLSEEVLARVWDLADTQSRGQLDTTEFAIAMHIVKMKLNGHELPDVLPPQLKNLLDHKELSSGHNAPPPAPHVRKTTSVAQSTSLGPSQGQTPVSAAAPSAQSNVGNTDLLQLDDAFFKPKSSTTEESRSQPSQQAAAPPHPQTTSLDQGQEQKASQQKAFVPSTSFGQQLLSRTNTFPQAQPQPQPQPQNQPPAPSQNNDQIEKLQKENKELLDKHADVTRENKQATEELANSVKSMRLMETQVAELRKTYDSEAKKVHDTKKEIENVKAHIAQLEKDVKLRQSGLQALKEQNQQHTDELDKLTQYKVELESQHADHQKNIEEHEIESQRLLQDINARRQLTDQHEATLQELLVQAEAARVRRDEHKRIAEEAKNRVEQAAADREKAEHDHAVALQQAQDAERERGLVEANAKTTSNYEPIPPTTLSESAVSFGSGVEDTPRTSPPSSEAAATSLEHAIPAPAFELPMQQPQSPATSSVANNPPQSVRGEFDESEPQSPRSTHSPHFSEEGVNVGPSASSALEQPDDVNVRRDSDSYEFVDAREAQETSGPARDGEFSKVLTGTSAETNDTLAQLPSAHTVETSMSDPANNLTSYSQQKSVIPTAKVEETVEEDSSDDDLGPDTAIPRRYDSEIPRPVEASLKPVALTTSEIFPTEASKPPTDDFGDAFDDLEEARVDDDGEAEDYIEPNSPTQQVPRQTLGPDEWQKLFANTTPAAASPSTQIFDAPSAATETSRHPDTEAVKSHANNNNGQYDEVIHQLSAMGFSTEEAQTALERTGYNISEATNLLLDKL